MEFHGISLVAGGAAFIANMTFEPLAADPEGAGLWQGRSWITGGFLKYYDGTKIVTVGQSSELTALSEKVARVVTGAGLSADGSLAVGAYAGTNYLTAATDLVGADKALDTQLKTVADATVAAQGDADKALLVLGTDAALAITGSYLTTAEDDVVKALTKLDGSLKAVADAKADITYVDDQITQVETRSKTYTDNLVQGLRWKDPVKNMVADHTVIVDPVEGDRYINTTDGKIYTKTADAWSEYTPKDNDTVINSYNDIAYTFDASDVDNSRWVQSSGGANIINAGAGLVRVDNVLNVVASDDTIVVEADSLKLGKVHAGNLHADVVKANSGVVLGADGLALNLGTGLSLSAEGVVSLDEAHTDTLYARQDGATFTGAVVVPAPTEDTQAARLADVKTAVAGTSFSFVAADAALEHTVTHNLGQKIVNVIVANAADSQIIPSKVTFVDKNTVKVTLAVAGIISVAVTK